MPKKNNQTTSPSEQEENPVSAIVNSVPFRFKLQSFSPDFGTYKPLSPIIVPSSDIDIEVRVPLQPELIVNANKISAAQLTNQKEETPLLTPLGTRYIMDQFGAVMGNKEEPEEKSATSDDEDWDDNEEGSEDKPAEKSSDEEWDDETKESNEDEKADFDSDEEWND